MKFRNKKTGEIIETGSNFLHMQGKYLYNSLAELNSEWEDYEEPKEWYYIDISGVVKQGEDNVPTHLIEGMEQIGNYFEAKEEAEKAVEKLKAWKRLKDSGFKLAAAVDDYIFCLDIYWSIKKEPEQVKKDLKLVFGDE